MLIGIGTALKAARLWWVVVLFGIEVDWSPGWLVVSTTASALALRSFF